MNVKIAFVLFFGLALAEEEQKAPGKIKWNIKFKWGLFNLFYHILITYYISVGFHTPSLSPLSSDTYALV